MTYVGRFAPSPTGPMHLGNLWAAVVAIGRARRARGRCLLRIEDLDGPRTPVGAVAQIFADLASFGLVFDDVPGLSAPVQQSVRSALYDAALDTLRARGFLYACDCSRKDRARIAQAPHAGDAAPPYDGRCRDRGLPFRGSVAWRFRVTSETQEVHDALAGTFVGNPAEDPGDIVVRRRDGLYAYHLAVVVDDDAQGVTEIVRGRDLLSSTPCQRALAAALGLRAPATAHIPLLVDAESGRRLAKRDHDFTLQALLARGVTKEDVFGGLGTVLGVVSPGTTLALGELIEALDDSRLGVATLPWPPLAWREARD